MLKNITIAAIFLALTVLLGCKEDDPFNVDSNAYGFTQSEMTVELKESIDSFNVIIEGENEAEKQPYISIDTQRSTAVKGLHYDYVREPSIPTTIGPFETIDGTKQSFTTITLMPQNITEAVNILFYSNMVGGDSLFIDELNVTITPVQKSL